MSISHSSRNDSRNVDWRVLLLASHHIEPKTFFSLGQLHHSRMGVSLGSSECSNSCLGRGGGSDVRRTFNVHSLLDMFIHLSDCSQEVTLQHLLESSQLGGRNLATVFTLLKLLQQFTSSLDVSRE